MVSDTLTAIKWMTAVAAAEGASKPIGMQPAQVRSVVTVDDSPTGWAGASRDAHVALGPSRRAGSALGSGNICSWAEHPL